MILRPKQSYLICASPRSGSTMLCNLLTQAGAGKPHSFFREKSVQDWASWWNMAPVTEHTYGANYVAHAIKSGENGTGIFGMRMMWDSVEPLLTRLAALNGPMPDLPQLTDQFGPLKFIHLSRADKVAQAVSLAIAEQSGLWHRNADGTVLEQTHELRDPVYDQTLIARELDGLHIEADGWSNWFAKNAIEPHRVTYEDLSAAPQDQLAGILTHIGLNAKVAQTIQPGTAKIANQTNLDWAKRFRAEMGLPIEDRQS